MNTDKIGLGTGIFLTSDISLILGINTQKVNSWLENYWSEKIHYFEKTKTVNFLTLIEVYVFNTFLENGVKRNKIKKFHKNLSEKLNTDYPFAHHEFFYSNKEIYTSKQTNIYFDTDFNYIIDSFIIPFTNKIEYSDVTNIATKFYPLGKNSNIVIDPQIQFGKPTVNGTRLTTDVIEEMLKNKMKPKVIASWYEVEEEIICEIAKFYKVA